MAPNTPISSPCKRPGSGGPASRHVPLSPPPLLLVPLLLVLGAPPLPAQSIDVFPNVRFLEYQGEHRVLVNLGPPTPVGFRVVVVEVRGIQVPRADAQCDSAPGDAAPAELAAAARAFVEAQLGQARQIDLLDTEWGPYYQLIARVSFDGRDLARELLARDLALPDPGTPVDWCK